MYKTVKNLPSIARTRTVDPKNLGTVRTDPLACDKSESFSSVLERLELKIVHLKLYARS